MSASPLYQIDLENATRDALYKSESFVEEAIGDSDLKPLARAWIAGDALLLQRLFSDAVVAYADFCIPQAIKEQDGETCPLTNLERQYANEIKKTPKPDAPLNMVSFANNLLAGIGKVQR